MTWDNEYISTNLISSTMNCTKNNTYDMSEICLDTNINQKADCFPSEYKYNDGQIAKIAGTLCVINSIVGFMGNLLTILAIPYAAKRNK